MNFSYSDLILDALEGITKVTAKQPALFPNVLLKVIFSNGENKKNQQDSNKYSLKHSIVNSISCVHSICLIYRAYVFFIIKVILFCDL